MSELIFPAPIWPTLPIAGADARVPVNRIFCVGRNYEDHAKEMGFQVDREAPFYFTKSPQTLVESGATVPYPTATENYHYEMELVVVIGKGGFRVPVEEANGLIYGYACGLDMTRRDLQLAARAKQRPWDIGKDVELSAVVSAVAPAERIGHPTTGRIVLSQNGEVRQSGDLNDLVWKVPELISNLSGFYHLAPGDLIFTGTPAGVGPVRPGDALDGAIDKVGEIHLTIGAPE